MQFHEKQVANLDLVTFVITLRETLGAENVVRALFKTSADEWANSYNQASGEHLIKGTFTSNQKTDAVLTYISKLMAQFMRSVGVRGTAWTKNTIASENFTNVSISNKIAATEFANHHDLFKIVVTRLMGFDDDLIAFALEENPRRKAELLVGYLASRFDLVQSPSEGHQFYPSIVETFADQFSSNGSLISQEMFGCLVIHASFYYHEKTTGVEDPFDALSHLLHDEAVLRGLPKGLMWETPIRLNEEDLGKDEEGHGLQEAVEAAGEKLCSDAAARLRAHGTSDSVPTGENEEI